IRRSLARHRGYVIDLAATADSRRLLTASNDLTALVWDISLTAVHPKSGAVPGQDEQSKLWEKLLLPDAAAAHDAMAALADHPNVAIAVIRSGIKPAARGPSDATLDRIVAALDDDTFLVRERATAELDGLGEAAVPGIRARLATKPPPE